MTLYASPPVRGSPPPPLGGAESPADIAGSRCRSDPNVVRSPIELVAVIVPRSPRCEAPPSFKRPLVRDPGALAQPGSAALLLARRRQLFYEIQLTSRETRIVVWPRRNNMSLTVATRSGIESNQRNLCGGKTIIFMDNPCCSRMIARGAHRGTVLVYPLQARSSTTRYPLEQLLGLHRHNCAQEHASAPPPRLMISSAEPIRLDTAINSAAFVSRRQASVGDSRIR